MSKTDRELLELAAEAAGLSLDSDDSGNPVRVEWFRGHLRNEYPWNPLTDDRDALQLAVRLHMTVRCYMGTTVVQIGTPGLKSVYEEVTDHADPCAATRRAITRAAAASIGEKSEPPQ